MRKQIILSYIVLVLIMIGFSALYIIGCNDAFNENVYKADTKQELVLLSKLLPKDKKEYQNFAQSNIYTNRSVSVIDSKGNTLAKAGDEKANDNKKDDDIKDALETGYGYLSDSDTGFYYVSMRVDTSDGYAVLRLAKAMDGLFSLTKQLTTIAIVGVCVCVLLAVAASVYFTKHIAKPIEEICSATQDVSKGVYGKTLDVSKTDMDIARLEDSFNVMSAILEYNVGEMSAQNVRLRAMLDSMTEAVVAVDTMNCIMLTNKAAVSMFNLPKNCIGENIINLVKSKTLMKQIIKVREKKEVLTKEFRLRTPQPRTLKTHISPIISDDIFIGEIFVVEDVTQIRKLEQMRTDFVSNVSHELKTPLTSIIGFADTLKSGAAKDPKDVQKFLNIIGDESDRLLRLINEILMLSSIETAQSDTLVEKIDLKQIAEKTESLLKPKAEKKNLKFYFDVQQGLPLFVCNRDRITQLFLNLCDNAIKYTEQGFVRASLRSQRDDIIFEVTDTGIGIEKEACDRIFERFYRVDKGRSRQMGGTGLGLSIVKHIAFLYGGTVEVKSVVGAGSKFTVTLPLNKD